MCQDCFQTQKELQEQFVIVQAKAKAFAIKNDTNVFIYQTPEGWQFMVEEHAVKFGIQPTGGIISRFVSST